MDFFCDYIYNNGSVTWIHTSISLCNFLTLNFHVFPPNLPLFLTHILIFFVPTAYLTPTLWNGSRELTRLASKWLRSAVGISLSGYTPFSCCWKVERTACGRGTSRTCGLMALIAETTQKLVFIIEFKINLYQEMIEILNNE